MNFSGTSANGMATRDNVELKLAGKASADGSAGKEQVTASSVGTDGNLKFKIGCQINGAAVDLVKANADANKVIETLKDEKEALQKGYDSLQGKLAELSVKDE